MPADLPRIAGLYVITAEVAHTAELLDRAEAALRGGARVLQYRDKGTDRPRRAREAAELAAACGRFGATFIVNDDVELAAAVRADGVHLGRDDPALVDARRRLGAAAIIGVSCYDSLAAAEAAQAAGADYVAFGSFFPSPTKPHAVRPSLDLLIQAKRRLSIPVVAIGGIDADNAPAVIGAGADALAVISSVFLAKDPCEAAALLHRMFDPAARGR